MASKGINLGKHENNENKLTNLI